MNDQAKVGQAFSRQRPLYLNLLDDLGSLDFFAVDGDSLILDCLSSPITDLHHGGQMLQLCYLVENFCEQPAKLSECQVLLGLLPRAQTSMVPSAELLFAIS